VQKWNFLPPHRSHIPPLSCLMSLRPRRSEKFYIGFNVIGGEAAPTNEIWFSIENEAPRAQRRSEGKTARDSCRKVGGHSRYSSSVYLKIYRYIEYPLCASPTFKRACVFSILSRAVESSRIFLKAAAVRDRPPALVLFYFPFIYVHYRTSETIQEKQRE
jgi:hypothetical protein